MKARLISLTVNDQERALQFYTSTLGFVKKTEIPMGEYQWLTVVSADEPDGAEIVLEPLAFEPAKIYQKALFDAGIPANAFLVEDADAEYQRLVNLGVSFSMPPAVMGNVKAAVLDDTCGNRIQIYQMLA